MKKLFFLCGLPRSGSTWLNSILNQNPDIFVTPQSPLVELLWRQYSMWQEYAFAEDFANDAVLGMKSSYLKGSAKLFYENLTDSRIVIDNKRGWQNLGNIEMYEDIWGERPKIICPVRNIEEIAASFTSLFQRNNKMWKDSGMFDVLMFCRNNMKTTYESKYRDCLFFVEYEDLVKDAKNTLEGIYKFIGEPSFEHKLEEIEVDESYLRVESMHDLFGLHDVKKGIVRSKVCPEELLSDSEMARFSSLTFWK